MDLDGYGAVSASRSRSFLPFFVVSRPQRYQRRIIPGREVLAARGARLAHGRMIGFLGPEFIEGGTIHIFS